jgi:hypothetical protein
MTTLDLFKSIWAKRRAVEHGDGDGQQLNATED